MFTLLLGINYAFNLLLIIIMIFFERREPVYIFAWMLPLLFLPLVGTLLYLVFGNGLKFKKRKNFNLKKQWDELYKESILKQKPKSLKIPGGKEELCKPIMIFNLNANKSLVTTHNEVTIYTNGKDKFNALFEDLRQAKETIHILYYTFRIDEVGSELISILEKKAEEGVEVRVVYDDIGSLHTTRNSFKDLIAKGGKVYPFFASKWRKIGSHINYRNHRKIVVIDGMVAYTGGMNIGAEYMSKDPKLSPWRDTHIRLEGESAQMLQIRFLQDFGYASHEPIDDTGVQQKFRTFFPKKDWSHLRKQYVQIVSSGPDTDGEELKSAFIKMIYIAKESIDIQTPYFVPDAAFLEAIKTAAHSDIRIRLMLPSINDNRFVDRINTSFMKELMECGVDIYLYDGFVHAKTMTIDQCMTTIGTSNLDIRSFQLNFEVNAFIYNVETAKEMTEIFERDLQHSRRATLEDEDLKKWYIRFEESLYRLLSLVL